jgi:predicted nuclease with TOPRIM domain
LLGAVLPLPHVADAKARDTETLAAYVPEMENAIIRAELDALLLEMRRHVEDAKAYASQTSHSIFQVRQQKRREERIREIQHSLKDLLKAMSNLPETKLE